MTEGGLCTNEEPPFNRSLTPSNFPTNQETKMPSTEKLKSAVITTAVVLATIYALNQISFSRAVVQKALTGA